MQGVNIFGRERERGREREGERERFLGESPRAPEEASSVREDI